MGFLSGIPFARVPLQNLVMKFFPESLPILLCKAVGILGWSFSVFFCVWKSQHNKPENFAKNFGPNFTKNFAPDCPLQKENFAQNFVLQKPFA